MRHLALTLPPALLLALAACDGAVEESAPPPRPIAWTTVEPADAHGRRTLSGVVQPAVEAPLSFEVGGRVATVAAELGDRVEKGAVLATLERRSLKLRRDERASALAEARAARAEAQGEFERQLRLHREGWASEAAFESAEAARDTAESRVATAEARLALAREDLADTELRAPYAGRVAARLVEPSQQVEAGATVLEIESAEAGFEVRVAAPETLVDRLARGGVHEVRLPARPGLVLDATIAEIGAEAVSRNAYPVTLALDATGAPLRSGMTAEVTLALEPPGIQLASANEAEAIARIPVTAFTAGAGDGQLAFVFDEAEGRLRRREIRVVDVAGDHALVARGLEPGEVVAAKGLDFLHDGLAVTLLGEGVERFHP